ncbi:ATP-dependent Clp protease proteolytic subunit [Thiohalophilus sp.]|uniref:ATP-dependent Clp protease proteolytic subunit n=1 Tax=Thiohalophilus sp. TaxID=3028392 RepID=UPI002ACE33EC|nr:ATP-dependent Clp protease proteolytic subunit [Thiohalophilus sp.]MDZ7802370.1 ATP-dependent Clp protease proteolytic subunit [Thiohalophilus sp.]
MSNFFNIRALAGTIILEIYGVITEYDMFEEYLRWQISEMGDDAPLAVRMSSPGGDPRIAMSLYRIIKDHKGPTDCYIEYMCDSAATLVACACDKVIGNEFPFEYMIHDPEMQPDWFRVEEGQALVDFLKKTRDDMVRIYTEETGMSEDAIRQHDAGHHFHELPGSTRVWLYR